MAEIADELGVTESRVSQMRAEALVLLKRRPEQRARPRAGRSRTHAPTGCAARRREAYFAAVAVPPYRGAPGSARMPPVDRSRLTPTPTEAPKNLRQDSSPAGQADQDRNGVHGRTPAPDSQSRREPSWVFASTRTSTPQLVPQPVGHAGPDVQVAGEAVQRLPHQPRRRRRRRPRDLRGPALPGRWPQGRRPQRPGRHLRRPDR